MCLNPWYKKMHDTGISSFDYVQLPCGKCVECRKSLSYSWRMRLLQENKTCVSSYFITLTYDEAHYRVDIGVSKDHIQKFLKRFRKVLPMTVRYFIVAEYGDKFGRGHYHGVFFFSLHLDSLILSKLLNQSWSYGNCYIGTVSNASISYVTDYLLKGSERSFDFQTLPFRLMSRRPALGGNFITNEIKNYYNQVGVEPKFIGQGRDYYLPRFYRDRIFDEERKSEISEKLKEHFRTHKKNYGKGIDALRYEQFINNKTSQKKSKRQ